MGGGGATIDSSKKDGMRGGSTDKQYWQTAKLQPNGLNPLYF